MSLKKVWARERVPVGKFYKDPYGKVRRIIENDYRLVPRFGYKSDEIFSTRGNDTYYRGSAISSPIEDDGPNFGDIGYSSGLNNEYQPSPFVERFRRHMRPSPKFIYRQVNKQLPTGSLNNKNYSCG
ncbi:hypothetical protein CEXT_236161 [Caerostris extrusa]|uniref:Uncharacterized protein n=1 Tax=Caerostris extrusa TaxID=172846 RepID=A0AAV4SKZ7_CAEEX|nr:hypothetical protein CEXT_236161 [Caerostris extrusa]